MRSWLKPHVTAITRPRRLDERTADASFADAYWHPNRSLFGAQGHPIR